MPIPFLTHLAALAYVMGDAQRRGMKAKRGEKMLPDKREFDLSMAFGVRDYEVAHALGRPYKYEFPEYLKERYETYTERSQAEDQWLMQSQVGIMQYLAKRDGWISKVYSHLIGKYDFDALREQQEEFMEWYNEAMVQFPHYAVRHVYIEDYPTKSAYFDGVQLFRKEHQDIEEIFGEIPVSDDLEYDKEIRRLFYAVDPSGEHGGLRIKYDALRFVLPYEYHNENWDRVKKYYMALGRILQDEGEDPNDFLERISNFSYDTRDKVFERYNSDVVTPRFAKEIEQLIRHEVKSFIAIANDVEPFMLETTLEGFKTMLRLDGYDPAALGV